MTGKEEEKEEEKKEEPVPMGSILELNKPEMCYNVFGVIFAVCAGSVQPAFGIVFAEILDAFAKYACAYDKDLKLFTGIGVIHRFFLTFSYSLSPHYKLRRLMVYQGHLLLTRLLPIKMLTFAVKPHLCK